MFAYNKNPSFSIINNMKKRENTKKIIDAKTNLSFEQIMKKALNTPLPKKKEKKRNSK